MHAPSAKPGTTDRRDFLQQVSGLAAGAAGLTATATAADAQPLLPTIRLGKHEVTRLIIGGNPVYGYSHFNKLLNQHQTAWHTPDRVVELLQRCERAGINTWQNSTPRARWPTWTGSARPAARFTGSASATPIGT